jgi:dGTPase
MPTLEAQVVDIADEIAYDNHDLDDGITSGLIDENKVSELTLWREANLHIQKEFGILNPKMNKYQIIKLLINRLVSDLIEQSGKNIKSFKITNIDSVRNSKVKLISFSKDMNAKRKQLREFLLVNLYRNYRVIRMADKAKRFIKAVFKIYEEKPDALPTDNKIKLKNEDKHIVICDYIAAMTDRYALDEYKKFFDPDKQV